MREAFENVAGQVGGCGIWCGSCAVGNGAILGIARRFEEVLDAHGVRHWAPPELDYSAFSLGLVTIGEIAACVGCRKGGGRDDCPLRVCSVARGVGDCTECADFGLCRNDELLQHMRDGARKARLFVRDPGDDAGDLMKSWPEQLKATWPSSLLFLEER